MTLFDDPDDTGGGPDVTPPAATPDTAPAEGAPAHEDAGTAPTVRLRLVVAYHGAGFHGFAVQPGHPTVGGALAEAVGRILRCPIELTCAGRTDKGVHGWGQVVHCDVPDADGTGASIDLDALQRAGNKLLAPSVVIRAVDVAPQAFDARRTALSRRYWYTIVNRPVNDPFLASTAWHVPAELDLRVMRLACDPFLGEHDFAAFCRKPRQQEASTVRRVLDARWVELGEGVLRFDITASSFCHQMVRSIVGTHVDVGQGRMSAGDMAWIIATRDRGLAAAPAPPYGLCLREVRYPPELSPAV